MAGRRAKAQRSESSVMAALKKAGTAQNRKVYARHGVRRETFGVSFADQKRLAKEIGQDLQLALSLWKTHNHDAQILATMVCDPEQISGRDLDEWALELDNYVVTDAVVTVAARSKLAREKAESWRKKTKHEWIARAGWMLVAAIASRGDPADTTWLKRFIPVIQEKIHKSKNRVKDAMNYALIAIGGSHPALTKPALHAADKIGHVEVDHGETGCKTRAAREYIEAMLKRRSTKETAPQPGNKEPSKKAPNKSPSRAAAKAPPLSKKLRPKQAPAKKRPLAQK